MKKGIQFSFAAVQAGQKASTVNAKPQLIANSTIGKFVVTSPVTKALGVTPGENIQFINNIAAVEAAIAQGDEAIVTWANENGVDLSTPEGVKTTIQEFAIWAIAKGVLLYEKNGAPAMVKERFSKEDKEVYITEHADEIVEALRDELVERVGNADATDEELAAAITVDDIESPKTQAISGSRTATTGNATGVGCQLNFTDTSIWNTLKADLPANTIKKMNRFFDVDLNTPINTTINNGKEFVNVVAYPITYKEDIQAIDRNSNN